jgi:hypothetical protein
MGNELLQAQPDDLDKRSFKASLAKDDATFVLEHFIQVVPFLVYCNQTDAKHGFVLLRDVASESETMMLLASIADQTPVDDMIDMLCHLRGMSTAVSAGAAVN